MPKLFVMPATEVGSTQYRPEFALHDRNADKLKRKYRTMYWRQIAISIGIICVVSVEGHSEESSCSVVFENERITFTGGAEPIDGDTFWLGIHKIRLKGIEALEIGQTCTKDGKPYDCIDRTFDEIKRVTSGDKVRCQVERGNFGKPAMDRNRYLAICYSGEADIGRAMVTAGWALATDDLYQTDEAEAKRGKRGLHATEFVIPAEFRKSKRGESECDEMERRCVKPKVGSPSSRKPLD